MAPRPAPTPNVQTLKGLTFDELWNGRYRVGTRYVAVSVINTLNHQLMLFLANSVWNWTGGWANVFAAVVAAGPAYLLSRAWVWGVTGKHQMRTEVLPFWGIALVGLLVSTLFAEIADRAFGAGIVVNVASLVGYFIVWVAKFFLLDRVFASSVGGNDDLAPTTVPGQGR